MLADELSACALLQTAGQACGSSADSPSGLQLRHLLRSGCTNLCSGKGVDTSRAASRLRCIPHRRSRQRNQHHCSSAQSSGLPPEQTRTSLWPLLQAGYLLLAAAAVCLQGLLMLPRCAGAGSGKTSMLVGRVQHLLESGVLLLPLLLKGQLLIYDLLPVQADPRTVVVTSFTNKVRAALASAARHCC